ncbi:MAG: SufS family cysteine desulfurase [bacterium]|nr:SufS family cysteine desulfurase [bacterium]
MNVKDQFPIFRHHPSLIYLDSAATSLKPQSVSDAVKRYDEEYSANVHRGIYSISEQATEAFESVRNRVVRFINASSADEIIFTKGTTEGLNLLAYAWGRINISEGDEIVTAIMEHHSNFVPWQQLAFEIGATFKVMNFEDDSAPIMSKQLRQVVKKKTKIVALTHVSNVLGTINPIADIVREVRSMNPDTLIIVDGAQAVAHLPVDVQQLGCDAYVFSGHKMYGPTGVGVLWAKRELLESMPPFLFGGSMIERVQIEKTTFAKPPAKFEAGTPPIAQVIGLGAAVEFIESVGREEIRRHEEQLVKIALLRLSDLVTMYGPTDAKKRGGLIAFSLHGIHGHDVAQVLAEEEICVRAGHHCAMPLHERLGIPATVRASFGIYNSEDDIDRLINGIKRAAEVFKK